jgi:nucleoside-diphosphate-sugar epimerase
MAAAQTVDLPPCRVRLRSGPGATSHRLGGLNKVFDYKDKQLRNNIHSLDVARFILAFFEKPRCGEVYNIGGGRASSVSILEAFATTRN